MTEGRKEARSWGLTAASRVHCGEAYGRLPPPPSVFQKTLIPTSPCGEQRGGASQEEDRGIVAKARPQGTALSLRSLFARRR